MPPSSTDHDALGHDLAVANQVFTDDVFIIELALPDRK
jgi:hypothetical protein